MTFRFNIFVHTEFTSLSRRNEIFIFSGWGINVRSSGAKSIRRIPDPLLESGAWYLVPWVLELPSLAGREISIWLQ